MFKRKLKTYIFIFTFLISYLFTSNSLAQNLIPSKEIKSPNISKVKIPLSLLAKQPITNYENYKPQINYEMLAGVGALTLGAGVAVHIYQANSWWQDQSTEFKIVNDWEYALSLDKMGHFFGTNLIAHGLSASLEAANLTLEESAIYGALGALAFELFIEVEDGFGPQWGFSPGDAGADVLGAAYSLGQYYYPTLKHIQPRVSYYPSKELLDGEHHGGNIIDDYAGQKYWLAFRMKELLPKNIAKYWPSFLMLSTGMGLTDWDEDQFGSGRQEFFIALDFDAETIPLHGKFWQFVKNTLNYIHFPMPGIRISPNTAAFVIVY